MKNDYYDGALGNIEDLTKAIFECALNQWTERPQLGKGYNKRALKLYDALIWTRVENTKEKLESVESSMKDRNKARKNTSEFVRKLTPETNDDLLLKLDEINKDIESWKYNGKVYRVVNCKKHEVEYHELIASWVSNIKAFESFNHLCKNSKYTFLIGNTGKDWAFNVNKYREHINNRHRYTEHESEIILPMNEKYVTDIFYGTLEEFYKYIEAKE